MLLKWSMIVTTLITIYSYRDNVKNTRARYQRKITFIKT